MDIKLLVDQMQAGNVSALSRLLTMVIDESEDQNEIMKLVNTIEGHAVLVGVTGPLGVGKSSLVNALIFEARKEGAEVGVIAVDPSSSVTGGGVLGDRFRMRRHAQDLGVFIRSVASRGSSGGVASATAEAVKLLAASGKDLVIVETTGTGQTDEDILKAVDICIVVLMPGLGDVIQIVKAGLMEIGDIYVVNKSDLPGSSQMADTIRMILSHAGNKERPVPPVFETDANTLSGIHELHQHIKRFHAFLLESGELIRRREFRQKKHLLDGLRDKLMGRLSDFLAGDDRAKSIIEKLNTGSMDLNEAVLEIEAVYIRSRAENKRL